jgi:protein O-mannosyl-transferase
MFRSKMIITNHSDDSYTNKFYNIFICLFLLSAISLIYWKIHTYDFIVFDDDAYVYDNPHIKNGITFDNIKWAFTSFHSWNWHPLTWISHMIDCQFFGLNPGWHHIINVSFHIINSLLLFFVFKKMTGGLWQSAFVAALFALHPLHVQSVAWISERKDVLSGLFFMITLWAYNIYVKHPSKYRYFLVALFFALGLLSKPMLVTMPFVLLLLDYWPLERIRLKKLSGINNSQPLKILTRLILEKIPLFFFSAISSVITFFAQESGVSSFERIPISSRIANSLVSYLTYIEKMIYPTKLAVLYPYVLIQPLWKVFTACCIIILISIMSIITIKKMPYFIVGWLWFLGTLVPVNGLVAVGDQSMADRYTYLPLIGLFLIIAWAAADLWKKWELRRIWLILSISIIILVLMAVSSNQIEYWKNSITLFEHTLSITSGNDRIHNNLAIALLKEGRIDKAINHFLQATRICPYEWDYYNNLGVALDKVGRSDEAMSNFFQATRINPKDIKSYNNLGAIFEKQGKEEEAINCYAQIIRINPNDYEAHMKLGDILYGQGLLNEAINHYLQATKINPAPEMAYNNLGNVFYKQGRINEAINNYLLTLKINPNRPETHNNLGNALNQQGRTSEAIQYYIQAIKLKPDFAEAYNSLGVAFINAGDINKAIACFKKASQINPAYSTAKNNLNLLIEQQKNSDLRLHSKDITK